MIYTKKYLQIQDKVMLILRTIEKAGKTISAVAEQAHFDCSVFTWKSNLENDLLYEPIDPLGVEEWLDYLWAYYPQEYHETLISIINDKYAQSIECCMGLTPFSHFTIGDKIALVLYAIEDIGLSKEQIAFQANIDPLDFAIWQYAISNKEKQIEIDESSLVIMILFLMERYPEQYKQAKQFTQIEKTYFLMLKNRWENAFPQEA